MDSAASLGVIIENVDQVIRTNCRLNHKAVPSSQFSVAVECRREKLGSRTKNRERRTVLKQRLDHLLVARGLCESREQESASFSLAGTGERPARDQGWPARAG